MDGERGEGHGEADGAHAATGPITIAPWWYRLSIALAVLPIVSAAVRNGLRGWVPTHDAASVALKAQQVLGPHTPLVGLYSQASLWAHLPLYMVGPIELYLLALPVRLFGPGAGVLLGMAGINGGCVVLTAVLFRRRLGPRAALVAMGFLTLLIWSMGSEMLIDPIPMNLGTLPFVLFLVAAWSVIDTDLVALPVLALVATYLFQSHLSFVLLVPLLAVWAVAAGAARLVGVRRREGHFPSGVGSSRRLVTWVGIAATATAACWIAPLYQELTNHPGNLTALAHAATNSQSAAPAPPIHTSFQAIADTLSVPPAWLPPSYGHPRWGYWGHPPMWVSIACFMVFCGLLGASYVASRKRDDRVLGSGIATVAVAVVVAAITTKQSTSGLGILPGYVRWLWSLGMLAWLLIAISFARQVRLLPASSARSGLLGRSDRLMPLAGLAAVAIFAACAVPRANHGSSTESWTIAPTRQLDAQVLPRIDPADGVFLLKREWSVLALSYDASLVLDLDRRGVAFKVANEERIEQYGAQFAYDGHNASYVVVLTQNPVLAAPFVRLGFASRASGADAKEMDALDEAVTAWVAARPLKAAPAMSAKGHEVPALQQAIVTRTIAELNKERTDPHYLVMSGDLMKLARITFSGPGVPPTSYVDTAGIGAATLLRWADLHWKYLPYQLAVYRAPLSAVIPPDPLTAIRRELSAATLPNSKVSTS